MQKKKQKNKKKNRLFNVPNSVPLAVFFKLRRGDQKHSAAWARKKKPDTRTHGTGGETHVIKQFNFHLAAYWTKYNCLGGPGGINGSNGSYRQLYRWNTKQEILAFCRTKQTPNHVYIQWKSALQPGHLIITATLFWPGQRLSQSFSYKNPFNAATPLTRPYFCGPLVTG